MDKALNKVQSNAVFGRKSGEFGFVRFKACSSASEQLTMENPESPSATARPTHAIHVTLEI
jgi:hypothetical protein